jgi:hypothetical protein
MSKNCKTCECGCGVRYASHFRDGKYYMNSSHFKKVKAKEKEVKEAKNKGGN